MRSSHAVATVASDSDFVPDRRLHPLSWLFVLLASIKQLIVPLIAVVVFGARDDGSAWGALFVFPLLIAAVWRQYLFRYGFGPRGLVIREGLLFRNIRQIEYERIENIDTERGVLHRLMNVAEVRLESSTGGKAEALIRVLGIDAVQELRERVFGKAQPAESARTQTTVAPREEVLLRLRPSELMRYGFVDNRGMLIVAAGFGFISQTGAMRGAGEFLQERVFTEAVGALGLSLAAVALGIFITIFLGVRLLSLLWALVALHDFTLSQQGTDLRIRYGLLTRIALTVRLSRIQAAHQTESVLHRFFGRVSIAVDLAGGGGQQVDESGSPQTRMRWLAPICSPRRAIELTRIALPMLAADSQPEWQPLATGAKMRLFRKVVLVTTLIFTAPAIFWFKFYAPLAWLVLVPLAWLHATQYVRHTRWALTREALLFRRGWLTRRLSIVPRSRVQVVHQAMSPFDRRKQMATLTIDTAGAGALSGVIRMPYLPASAAAALAAELHGSARDFMTRRNKQLWSSG
jgi:putative membrane protein